MGGRKGKVDGLRWRSPKGPFQTRSSLRATELTLDPTSGVRLAPRSVVGPYDPEHEAKLRHIQRLIARLPSDDTVVFQDGVNVFLNPMFGPCSMVRGSRISGTKETGANCTSVILQHNRSRVAASGKRASANGDSDRPFSITGAPLWTTVSSPRSTTAEAASIRGAGKVMS
jgi:hypothetical protein